MTAAPTIADPLQAALAEAASLMESLGVNDGDDNEQTAVIQGFSIDSDDEDDEAVKESSLHAVDDDDDAFHPLHDNFLSEPLQQPPPNGAWSVAAPAAVAPFVPQQQLSSYMQSPLLSGGVLPQQQRLPQHSMMGSPLSPVPPTTTSAASLGVLKAQTSRFASNLATMAQRGFTQVATATTTSVVGAPMMMATTPPSTLAIPGAVLGSSSSNAALLQPPQQQQLAVELDNEQKATLVRTHVGELLPGERVIMFLSNLLHVSDSTGFSYNHTTEPNILWFCAMTYYRLILFGTHHSSSTNQSSRPADWNAACWPGNGSISHNDSSSAGGPILQIPLASMDRVEKSVFSGGATTLMGLLIHGKDNGRQLRFTTPSYADTLRAHEALQTYAFPGRRNLGYLFAFESKREAVMASIVTEEGTGKKTVTLPPTEKRFDAVQEFQRQMARGNNNTANNNIRPWAIWTSVNQSYQTCTSYPSILVGPATLDENMPEAQRIIRQCAAFRSENRLPALTWTSGVDGASLWRCSQPKIGLQGNRSSADELFLKHIMESAASANAMAPQARPNLSRFLLGQLTGTPDTTPMNGSSSSNNNNNNWIPEPTCGLKILDLRPRSAAMANRTGGYGYENTSNYPGTTLQFCNISNIHAVRDAYQKLSALCNNPTASDLNWHAAVEDTKWLQHVRLILAASWETAYWIHVHRLPVLLHCSHGWDRTSQVAVLAQLLLDPYHRTRRGFCTLLEKDFMAFGHPFHTRCAHGEGRDNTQTADNGGSSSAIMSSAADQGQMSPIFIQLLDCVVQLVSLYPECFEFNTKYLLIISEHVYSCRFGNFLCDTEREREMVAGIRQRTHSLWDYLETRVVDTIHPAYTPERAAGVLLMPLPTLLRNVTTIWSDRHLLHGPKPTLRWLPAGVPRPVDPQWARDHQSCLVTVQENVCLMLGVAAAVAKAVDKGEAEEDKGNDEEEGNEEDFTIS